MLVIENGGGGSSSGSGVQKVNDLAALTALAGTDGDLAVKLDSNELYYHTGAAWVLFDEAEGVTDNASGGAAIQMTNASNGVQMITGASSQTIKLPDATTLSNGKKYLFVNLSTGGGITIRDFGNNLKTSFLIGRFGYAILTDNSTSNGTWSFARTVVTADQVTVTPSGNLSSTDTQAALVELQGDIDTLGAAALAIGAFGAAPDAKGATSSGFTLTLQPADATHPGAVSAAAQSLGGEKRLVDGAVVGAATALGANEVFKVISTTKAAISAPVQTTAERDAMGTPTTGMRIYNSTTKRPEFYDGTRWQSEEGYNIAAAQTPAGASTPTILGFRRQVLPISGSGGAVTLADLGVANALEGDELLLIGTSDTNTVTIVSATNTVVNGDCTLGLDDTLTLVYYSSKWREKERNI